jgi:hypothetical protein
MATVNYIPYKKQSAFTLRGVIQYACLKNKKPFDGGLPSHHRTECCAETRRLNFAPLRRIKKDGDVQFYHYSQASRWRKYLAQKLRMRSPASLLGRIIRTHKSSSYPHRCNPILPIHH